MNKNKAAAIIDGPEDVLNCNEEKRNHWGPMGLPTVGHTCYMNSVLKNE